MTIRVGLVGLGRAGSALARSLVHADVDIGVIVSRQDHATVTPALPVVPTPEFSALDGAQLDVVFLCVPDDVIGRIVDEILPLAQPPRIVAHLSGVHGASALAKLGNSAAAFHPLSALDVMHRIPDGTLVAVDAIHAANLTTLHALATTMGLSPVTVSDAHRRHYHAAAAITANLSVALVDVSMALMGRAGIDDAISRPALARLLSSTARNVAEKASLKDALTGPVARGDVDTIALHLKALRDDGDDDVRVLYRLLTRRLANLTDTGVRRSALFDMLDDDEKS